MIPLALAGLGAYLAFVALLLGVLKLGTMADEREAHARHVEREVSRFRAQLDATL